MNGLLLDTHIWFWYLVGSSKLPPRIKSSLDSSPDPFWLSPISVWELSMLARRGRIEMKSYCRSWVTMAFSKLPVKEAPINVEVSLKSQEIQFDHKDPADHFLAATALVYDLMLVTVDRRLIGLKWLQTFSG